MSTRLRADVAIAGAGIVGLAHAVEAVERGLSVVVVERDNRASGASIRNFGHNFVTAQAGDAREAALEGRKRWLTLAEQANFWLAECGSVLVARADDELAVMSEFVAETTDAQLLSARDVLARVPVAGEGVVGGLWTPLDCRVDPREAIPAITAWLAAQGVTFLWGTSALEAQTGVLRTNQGEIDADCVVVATGHDLGFLFPELVEQIDMQRCTLHMLRVAAPDNRSIEPALATGLSLLRYRGFADCPSLSVLRRRLERERPELIAAGLNLLITQRPDGDLVVGDTHHYARTPSPFSDERLDELILGEAATLLGVKSLEIRERWRGVYAYAADRDFLVAEPAPGVRAVVVTAGIGMTTALGLAPRVIDDFLAPAR